jgi:hypothetical protein
MRCSDAYLRPDGRLQAQVVGKRDDFPLNDAGSELSIPPSAWIEMAPFGGLPRLCADNE